MRTIRNLFLKASVPQVMGYAFGFVIVILSVAGFFIEQAVDTVGEEVTRLQNISLEAESAADGMAYDVVQVQQFITDAALTGNAEGLNEASAAQERFNSRADRLKALLTQGYELIGEEPPKAEIRLLDEMKEEVSDLVDVGLVMASTYWSEGREAGNEVMKGFDESSSAVSSGPAKAIKRLRERTAKMMASKMVFVETMVTGQAVVIGLLLVAVFFVVRNALRSRLLPMINALRAWEGATMEARITNIRTSGLTGDLSWALNDFGDRMEAFMRDLTASLTAMSAGQSSRRMDLRGLSPEMRRSADLVNTALDAMARSGQSANEDKEATQKFEQDVRELVTRLAEVGAQMRNRAERVAALAEDSAGKATGVSEGASQASHNVETVAAAAEQLSASISEVSRQVADASGVVETAAAKGSGAVQQVEELGQASRNISGMVEVINDIAAQTNLLALNASIEAARAGEAGRGFAVVAGEVKDLAEQTSKATDEIAGLISSIQKESDEAVAAIKEIAQIIEDFKGTFEQINLATDEQNAAASEISNSVQAASQSVSEVLGNIEGVAAAAADTGNASSEMLSAADEVVSATDDINSEVDQFLGGLSYNR